MRLGLSQKKNKNMTKVNTPFGIVSKLKDGSYTLRNSSNSIAYLKESEDPTFHFLIDVGFVIKSYQYILKAEDGYKKIEPNKIEFKQGTLIEYLDAMESKTILNIDAEYTLIINMVKYHTNL
jgi:hypothetical protein